MFRLRYAYGNLLFGRRGECAALYRLGMVSYPFLPAGEKWMLQRRLQRLASGINADFSLWRVNRAYPAEDYLLHTRGLLDERHQTSGVWEEYLVGHEERLHGLRSHVPEVYLAVSLAGSGPSGVGAGLVRWVDRARARVEDFAGVRVGSPISNGLICELAAREERVFERVSRVVGARRARTVELQWLLRRAACRGISEPDLDRHWVPDALIVEHEGGAGFAPLGSDLRRCTRAVIREEHQTLIIDSEHGRCHQALLVLGALADAPEFPGAGAEVLFAPLEALGWPVDAVVHARWLGDRQALAQVRRRIADVEHAYEDQLHGAAHGPSLLAGADRVLAREYEAQLQAGGHPPMLYAQIGLAVGADSQEELERRVALLKEQYGDIQLHRPVGLQYRLWLEHLPCVDGWA